ncbi:hypothetical protein ACK356_11350 [Aeromonas veronii]
MKVNSFIFEYYKQQCEPKPVHVPAMPAGNRAVMEAIRDEAIAIATKAQAEGNKQLLKALAAVPTEFPQLDAELARIDAEILSVQNDMAKRPKCAPSMSAAIRFAKALSNTHVDELLASCADDAELLALHGVYESEGRPHDAAKVLSVISNKIAGYDTVARLDALQTEKRGICSYAEGLQESLVQSIGRAHAPHLVQAAEKAKFGL